MSRFASRARQLEETLIAVGLRVREIRGLALVDETGLALVSTMHARGLEEELAALAGTWRELMARARTSLQTGPLHFLHVAGRDRQIFLVPVTVDMTLAALVEAGATPSTVSVHLLATVREILESSEPTDGVSAN